MARYTQGLGIDEPLVMYRGGLSYYYNADGLGSITSLTDASGQIAATYTYDSFGKLTASTGTVTNPFRYTGRELDSSTGLYYYRARYYDAAVGRFVSNDPIRFRTGTNFYMYVLNNPVLLVDPLGACPSGTHEATPNEIAKILSAANDYVGRKIKHSDLQCNQLVDRSINKAFPGTLPDEYNTHDIRNGKGPFEKIDSPAVGDLALFDRPGHVTFVTKLRNGKVSQMLGSQTSTGPAYVDLPDYFWQGRLDAKGNVQYFKICLPN